MRVLPRTIAEPGVEPVAMTQMRAQLRLDDDTQDVLLLGYVRAARQYLERVIDRPLQPRTVVATFEAWPNACNPDGSRAYGAQASRIVIAIPVVSVDAITYTDATGATVAWNDFVARTDQGGVTTVRPKTGATWPALGNDPIITLTAQSGFDPIPEPLVQAIMMLAAHFFENRETVTVGEMPAAMVFAFDALTAPYRVLGVQ